LAAAALEALAPLAAGDAAARRRADDLSLGPAGAASAILAALEAG
jgi:hypothetical protein